MDCVSIPHPIKLLALRLAENRKLTTGDKVLISPTSLNTNFDRYIEHVGVIDDILSTAAYVCFPTGDLDLPETVQIPLGSICHHFMIGDYIRVKAGSLQGRVGWVIGIDYTKEQIAICDPDNPGRSGVVKTISLCQKAAVELWGLHAFQNKLEELKISDLAFELDLHKWYRLEVKQSEISKDRLVVNVEAISGIPVSCSMLDTIPEPTRHTPAPEVPMVVIGELGSSTSPEDLDKIPKSCWLMKLPHRDTFKTLKILIQSYGTYDNGKWDGNVGFYKGSAGNKVKFSHGTPVTFWFLTIIRFKWHREGVNILYDSTCPSKAAKMEHWQSRPPVEPVSDNEPAPVSTVLELTLELHDIETTTEKNKQDMSTRLATFSDAFLQQIQEELLSLETEAGAGGACEGCQVLCKPFTRNQDKVLQLVRHQLFPPTVDVPQMVFTFEVLDHFHRHSLSAKTSAYDYFDALRRHTDAPLPHSVPNRYNEFRLVMCLWRHLVLLWQSGYIHRIDRVLTDRRPLCLALRCFACPEVGFNLDEWVLELARSDKIHIYTLFVSADGNFRLQRKRKNDNPNDKALNKGNAYFVDEAKFLEYLTGSGGKDVTSLCSKLKAVRQQERSKFKDAVISGVIGVQCARHGLYLPQVMVDLTKGELFIKTDYALFTGLGAEGLRQERIVISYDIWCQYHKKLKSRLEQKFPLFLPLLERGGITGAVPKMHINGHKAECQIENLFIYEPHSGMTCGEGIESAWSEQNHAAAFTKEQNPGHCHNILDDFNRYWNWMKLQRLSSFLKQQRQKWGKIHATRLKSFKRFSETISNDLLREWQSMKYPAFSKSCLYELQGSIPSREKAYTTLLEKEQKSSTSGVTELIQRGLELEQLQQCLVRATGLNIEEERPLLLEMLQHWRISYEEIFPLIPFSIIEDAPEKTRLLLPSSLPPEGRKSPLLKQAAKAELLLRCGHAYDLLQEVRDSIHEYYYLVTEKGLNPNSQSLATRNQQPLRDLVSSQEVLIDQYMHCVGALQQLGMTEDDELKPLSKDQLWGKNIFLPHQLGDSTKDFPWFWFVGRSDKYTRDAWLVELECVRWFRERAAIERLQEELEILEEEFHRVHKSFSRMNEVWTILATHNQSAGFAAYALRQAHIHASFAKEAWSHWKEE
ncbi:hypothetical protein NP233_g12170 [Leucocoprinus birnbaumii]|uniref:CxC2-like cysteine cluster KDZ transposase-associated domain-containing protein n=1 Tax=Leucocoprinus birnbaumii TaxID=56174 RepID=A0AAD5VIV2_9AGAR|nr:hypothetical protein NP233_g12170 [Leucocoprinus birnbaumii]